MQPFLKQDPAEQAQNLARAQTMTNEQFYFTDQLNDGNEKERLWSVARKAYELKVGGALQHRHQQFHSTPAMWNREIAQARHDMLHPKLGNFKLRFKIEKARADNQKYIPQSASLS
jgi:hypothetical protein